MLAGVGPERRAKMNEQESKKRRGPRTPNNHTTTGFRISNELWAVLQPLLPLSLNTHRFGGGRPRVSDRQCADAIFYVLRTGCQWQALDQTELCAHSTAHEPMLKNGPGQECSSNSGKPESYNLMSYVGSTGTGSQWTEL
jgi:putative transposase of IS4/5 family DUF4096